MYLLLAVPALVFVKRGARAAAIAKDSWVHLGHQRGVADDRCYQEETT